MAGRTDFVSAMAEAFESPGIGEISLSFDGVGALQPVPAGAQLCGLTCRLRVEDGNRELSRRCTITVDEGATKIVEWALLAE